MILQERCLSAMNRQNRKPNDAEGIRVYQNLWKNLLLGICSLLFAIMGIFIIADDNCRMVTKIIGGWLGSIFFGVGGLSICIMSLYNYLRRIPYLVIYKDRIEVYVQFKASYDTVYFNDVQKFRLITIGASKQIAIDYRPSYIVQRMKSHTTSNFIKKIMRFNLNKAGAIESILASNLSMKRTDILRILNEHIKMT